MILTSSSIKKRVRVLLVVVLTLGGGLFLVNHYIQDHTYYQRVQWDVDHIELNTRKISEYDFDHLVLKSGEVIPCVNSIGNAISNGWIVPYENADSNWYAFTTEPKYSFCGSTVHRECERREVSPEAEDVVYLYTGNTYEQPAAFLVFNSSHAWHVFSDCMRILFRGGTYMFDPFWSKAETFNKDYIPISHTTLKAYFHKQTIWIYKSNVLPDSTLLVFYTADKHCLQKWVQYPTILQSDSCPSMEFICEDLLGTLYKTEQPKMRRLHTGIYRWQVDKYLPALCDSKDGPPQTEDFRKALSTAIDSANQLMRQEFVNNDKE